MNIRNLGFAQVLIIHAVIVGTHGEKERLPLAIAWMSSKQRWLYEKIFSFLLDSVLCNPKIHVVHLISDDEQNIHGAFTATFEPHYTIYCHTCSFHYEQNLISWLKNKSLWKAYYDSTKLTFDPLIYKHFIVIKHIPILPRDLILPLINFLKNDNHTKLRKVIPFYEYVEAKMLRSGYLDRISWFSFFMRMSDSDFWYTDSTNNIGESWNSGFNAFVKTSIPNGGSFQMSFQSVHKYYTTAFKSFNEEPAGPSPAKRTKIRKATLRKKEFILKIAEINDSVPNLRNASSYRLNSVCRKIIDLIYTQYMHDES